MKLNNIIIYSIFAIMILGAVLPVASYVIIGFLIVLLIVYKQEKLIWNHLIQNKILIMMIISAVLSSLLSDLWYISIFFTAMYIMKILFCSIVSCYLEKRLINKVIFVIIILGIIVSIIGIVQYLYFDESMPNSWVDSKVYDINFRAYSTFFNPNILAVFLDLTILTSVVWFESNKAKLARALAISCSVLSTICLLFTYSRNGWISLCVAFLALALINRKFIKYLALFPAIFFLFDFLGNTGRLLPQNIVADSSIDYRIKIWTAALNIIRSNPIFGIGQGTVWEQLPLYSNELKAYVSHVHSIYLQKLVDTGLVGILLFILLLKHMWNRLKRDVLNNEDISIIALGFYIVLLVNGIFDAVSFQYQISIFAWIFIGINLAKLESSKISSGKDGSTYNNTF